MSITFSSSRYMSEVSMKASLTHHGCAETLGWVTGFSEAHDHRHKKSLDPSQRWQAFCSAGPGLDNHAGKGQRQKERL